MVRAIAGVYPRSAFDELVCVGNVAVLEAHLTYDATAGAAEATWVRRIVHWRISAEVRQMRRGHALLGDADAFDDNIAHDPEQGYLRHLVLDKLRWLTPRQSTILLARIVDGETFESIGQSLGVSTQQTHKDYQIAVQHLRKLVVDGG